MAVAGIKEVIDFSAKDLLIKDNGKVYFNIHDYFKDNLIY